MTTRCSLLRHPITLSVLSVVHTLIPGAESSSHALVFYGLQFAVAVVAALFVVWRFLGVVRSGDEGACAGESTSEPRILR